MRSALRATPADADPAAVAQVDALLDTIARDENVAIVLAVESGSRAWGFPSPDSDYDGRFVFVRPLADYLTPWPRRDVIERPVTALIDVNGWDLTKALDLLLRGNAVLIEWLSSPFIYAADAAFVDDIRDLASRCADVVLIARHYLHLGERQHRLHLASDTVALKKLFYVLRPALALRWLRMHAQSVPPMNLPRLMTEAPPPGTVIALIDDLISRKAQRAELGREAVPPELATFVEEEFALARSRWMDQPPRAVDRAEAEALFRRTVLRLDGAR